MRAVTASQCRTEGWQFGLMADRDSRDPGREQLEPVSGKRQRRGRVAESATFYDVCALTERDISWIRRRLREWAARRRGSDGARYPWRDATAPWLALLAEVLLQRTRADAVRPVFERIAREFPEPADLVRLGAEGIRELIKPLGLPWRAEFLQRLAALVQERGNIPECFDDLVRLPGVGPYAAGAFLVLHRNRHAPLIDANIVRWLCRFVGHPYDGETRRMSWVRKTIERLIPRRNCSEFGYALLDFTREVCRPTKPACEQCVLRKRCAFYLSRTEGAGSYGGLARSVPLAAERPPGRSGRATSGGRFGE